MMIEENPPFKLIKKLHLILSKIESIPKEGYNDFHKYEYIREADVTEAIRKLLVNHGIFIFTTLISSTREHNQGANKNQILTKVETEHTFVDVDSGERWVSRWIGEGMDTGDKGIYKAITGAVKYFIMKNFQIGAETDPENEQTDTRPKANNIKPQEAKRTPQPASKPLSKPQEKAQTPVDKSEQLYVIPFGKFKGKTLKDVGVGQLKHYLEYLAQRELEEGKSVAPMVKNFITKTRAFIERNVSREQDKGPLTEIEIPF